MSNCWSNAAGCNGLGQNAVGSWAREPLQRVIQDQTPQKETALLRDQLRIGGLRLELWTGVTSSAEHPKCACYKESFQQADRKCSSCHGTGFVPGYLKWGYETYWMSATDAGSTFTGTEVTSKIRSSKVQLQEGELTGTIESTDHSFTRSVSDSVWEYDAQTFIRDSANSSITVEYSLDSGVTWSDISNLVIANPSSGTIRFKATLTRDTVQTRSPLFEIVRARYSRIPLGTFINPYTTGPTEGPWILAINGYPDQQYTKSEHGDQPQGSTTFWTSGMSMFDPLVTVGSDDELIHGPNILVQFMDGALAGKRYRPTSWKQADPFAFQVTSQDFQIRVADPVGPYGYVW
jgi:hypothetical protein